MFALDRTYKQPKRTKITMMSAMEDYLFRSGKKWFEWQSVNCKATVLMQYFCNEFRLVSLLWLST